VNWCDHFCTTIVILSDDDRRIFRHLTTQSTLHQNAGSVTSAVISNGRILDLTMKTIFWPKSLWQRWWTTVSY